MRLSDAIRLGSMLKPQSFEAPWIELRYVPATCALAAASDALGLEKLDVGKAPWVGGDWQWTYSDATCPVCAVKSQVFGVVTHLNDQHFWTRERIADWIETMEPPITAPAEHPAHVVVAA